MACRAFYDAARRLSGDAPSLRQWIFLATELLVIWMLIDLRRISAPPPSSRAARRSSPRRASTSICAIRSCCASSASAGRWPGHGDPGGPGLGALVGIGMWQAIAPRGEALDQAAQPPPLSPRAATCWRRA